MASVPNLGKNLRKEPFTMISNNFINDPNVSLEAKSVLMIFLSNKESWNIDIREIASRSTNGRDKHYKCLDELIANGYMARVEFRRSGRFTKREYLYSDNKEEVIEGLKKYEEMEGVIIIRSDAKVENTPRSEQILDEEERDISAQNPPEKEAEQKMQEAESRINTEFSPFPENPDTVEPDTVIPYAENQDINNNNINNTNIKNNKYNNSLKDFNKLSEGKGNKSSSESATKITRYFIEQLKSQGSILPTEKVPDESKDELLFYTWTAPAIQLLNNGFTPEEVKRAIDFALTDSWWVARVRNTQQLKDNFEQLFHKATAAINQSGINTDPEYKKFVENPNFVAISVDKQSLVESSIFAGSRYLKEQGLFAFRMPGTFGEHEQALVVPKERVFEVRKGNKIRYAVFLEANSPVQILDYFGNPLPLEKRPTGYDVKSMTFNDSQGAILPFTGS